MSHKEELEKTTENRIKELKNAALAISKAFDFEWNDKLLLEKLSDTSFCDTKEIFEEKFSVVKEIFSSLPPEDELETILRNSDGPYSNEGIETYKESEKSAATGMPYAENDTDSEDASKESQEYSESSSEGDE